LRVGERVHAVSGTALGKVSEISIEGRWVDRREGADAQHPGPAFSSLQNWRTRAPRWRPGAALSGRNCYGSRASFGTRTRRRGPANPRTARRQQNWAATRRSRYGFNFSTISGATSIKPQPCCWTLWRSPSMMRPTASTKSAGSRSGSKRGQTSDLAHTYEIIGPTNVRIRIISARKATRRQRRLCENEPR
jgi:hypothetical protein